MTSPHVSFLFAQTHEWANANTGEVVAIGISQHAQEALGDVVFLEPPKLGSLVKQGEPCAVVESVKAASDIHAPISGTVVEVNSAVLDSPELLNQDPYSAWIFKIQAPSAESLAADLSRLHSLSAYESSLN